MVIGGAVSFYYYPHYLGQAHHGYHGVPINYRPYYLGEAQHGYHEVPIRYSQFITLARRTVGIMRYLLIILNSLPRRGAPSQVTVFSLSHLFCIYLYLYLYLYLFVFICNRICIFICTFDAKLCRSPLVGGFPGPNLVGWP